MSDYINREDAIKAFDPNQRRDWYTPWIVETLKDLPSADVAPVRHGRWIEMSYDEYKCSACEKVVREEILYAIKPSDREDDPMHIANYCPNCGARMDGEDKNCDTCKHYDKWWDDIICDGCTKAHSNWERKDDDTERG